MKRMTDRSVAAGALLALLLTGCDGARSPSPSESGSPVAASPVPAPPSPSPSATPPKPDLAACPKLERSTEDGLLERDKPLPIPSAFTGIMTADMNHFAVATLSGKTICVDVRWAEHIESIRPSRDQRFLGIEWMGYEAFGFVVVDRAGRGDQIETGTAPVWSSSGRRLAAVDLSESGFGELNAFAVWDVTPAGFKQVATVSDDPLPRGDWRMGPWRGETCVSLSLVPSDREPEQASDMAKAPRDTWFAAAANSWKPQPGTCPQQ